MEEKMDEKNLHTLEFTKIREMLAAHALTDGAKERALSLLPANYPEEARLLQRQTTDARRLLDHKGHAALGHKFELCGAEAEHYRAQGRSLVLK